MPQKKRLHRLDRMRLAPSEDGRIKLTEEQRLEIKSLYHDSFIPIRAIARKFEGLCSRRLIQLIIFPDRMAALKKKQKDEKHHIIYGNTKEYHRVAIAKCRAKKKAILSALPKEERIARILSTEYPGKKKVAT